MAKIRDLKHSQILVLPLLVAKCKCRAGCQWNSGRCAPFCLCNILGKTPNWCRPLKTRWVSLEGLPYRLLKIYEPCSGFTSRRARKLNERKCGSNRHRSARASGAVRLQYCKEALRKGTLRSHGAARKTMSLALLAHRRRMAPFTSWINGRPTGVESPINNLSLWRTSSARVSSAPKQPHDKGVVWPNE